MIEIFQAWLNDFLERRNLNNPDGRPLYAYRCKTNEFGSLKILLSGVEKLIRSYTFKSLHKSHPGVERLFVLYCAEWWRRNYAGGPWKWQPIFDSIKWPELELNTRGRFVERGLSYWKRNLIRQSGNREFLLTVACEGGLPINLVKNDTGYLRSFLRAVLDSYATYAKAGVDAVELSGFHLDRLPKSLRQSVVQEIAGLLIETIWNLQNKTSQNADPVAELDQVSPGWREQLPIILEDRAANALMLALLQHAKKIRSGKTSRIRFTRHLIKSGEQWQLHAELQLPDTFENAVLLKEIGTNTLLGERLELRLAWSEKLVRVASLMLNGNSYIVSLLDLRRLKIQENAHAEISCLVYERGQQIGCLPLPNGNALSNDLPLVFVDREGDSHTLDFLGQGSLSSRFPELYVATSKEARWQEKTEPKLERITESVLIDDHEFPLYKLQGEVSILLDEATQCVIRTGQSEESEAEYHFEGQQNYLIETKYPAFVGMPRMKRTLASGKIEQVPATELYWSTFSGRRQWSCVKDAVPRGLVELRHNQNATCYFARRLLILPERFDIKLFPSDRDHEGKIELQNIDTSLVSWKETDGAKIEIQQTDTGVVLHCTAQTAFPGMIAMEICWQDGCRCSFSVPFPVEGGRFVKPDGSILKTTDQLSIEELYGHAAIAISLRGRQHFYIHGQLNAVDIDPEMRRAVGFKVPLPGLDKEIGIHEVPIYELYHRIQQLFNFSSDKDSVVSLELLCRGSRKAKTDVSQFSAGFKYDAESGCILLDPKESNNISEFQRDKIELLPLFDPEEEAQELALDQEQMTWKVPEGILQKGPWLIVAPVRIRRKIRPRILPPSTQKHVPLALNVSLLEIISEPEENIRKQAMQALFEQMTNDLTHDQWPILRSYVRRFATVHPDCLDWIAVAAENPCTLIGLLLLGGGSLFETVYEWHEYLPFRWWMLPLKDWQKMISKHLQPFEDNEEVRQILAKEINNALRRIDERNPTFSMIHEIITIAVLQRDSNSHTLEEVAKRGSGHSWALLQHLCLNNLFREKIESKDWPMGIDREDWIEFIKPEHQAHINWLDHNQGYQRSILDAPLAAAYFSVTGLFPKQSHRAFLSAFREFHPDWFDTAFRATQAILLTQFNMGYSHE